MDSTPSEMLTMALANEGNRPAVNALTELGLRLRAKALASNHDFPDNRNCFLKARATLIRLPTVVVNHATSVNLLYINNIIAPIIIEANNHPERAPTAVQQKRAEETAVAVNDDSETDDDGSDYTP